MPTYDGTKTIIEHAHKMIHRGRAFHAMIYSGSQAADKVGKHFIINKIGATQKADITFSFGVDSPGWLRIIRGPSISASGSAVTIQNRNWGSSRTGSFLVYSGATLTTGSRIMAWEPVGSTGIGQQVAGGTGRGQQEWKITGSASVEFSGSAAGQVSIDVDWYED